MNEKCIGCGKQYEEHKGFGSYRGDKVIEWVCDDCWKKGIRTELHKKADDRRM